MINFQILLLFQIQSCVPHVTLLSEHTSLTATKIRFRRQRCRLRRKNLDLTGSFVLHCNRSYLIKYWQLTLKSINRAIEKSILPQNHGQIATFWILLNKLSSYNKEYFIFRLLNCSIETFFYHILTVNTFLRSKSVIRF